MKDRIIRMLLRWLGIDERVIMQLKKRGEEYIVTDGARMVSIDFMMRLNREMVDMKPPPYEHLLPAERALPPVGKVYFVFSEGTGMVKIGYSQDPARRLMELRTGASGEIRLLATINGGTREERALHKRFATHRRNGEWFVYDDEIRSYVESLSN